MKPIFIAGPCVIESAECLDEVAKELVRLNEKYKVDIIFKSSFDKANRTSISSYRGPGMENVLQIPAFLCRQTDLLVSAAKTGKIVNVKKAQFLSGEDMKYPVQKVKESGNEKVWLTERGNIYGYNNFVVDFRNIPDMKKIVPTVIMDCTHSVQRPGAAGGKTVGNREFVPSMALAAKAFGATGYFFEVHPNPDEAKSDGPNMLFLKDLEKVIISLLD